MNTLTNFPVNMHEKKIFEKIGKQLQCLKQKQMEFFNIFVV